MTNDKLKWEEKETYNQEKRQDFRREDNNNKRTTKIRNIKRRTISIGPKPFLLFYVWCAFYVEIKSRFPWKKGIFVNFWMSPSLFFSLLFSLPCLTSPCHSLSLFLVIFLFSSFLFCFCFSLFFFCLALFLCFCFMQRRTSRYFISKVLLINVYFVLLLSCFCLVFVVPFCYLCFFHDASTC